MVKVGQDVFWEAPESWTLEERGEVWGAGVMMGGGE